MAQLKDLLVTGDTRLLGNIYANIPTNDLVPFASKTYTDIIGNSSDNAQAYNAFYFGSVRPNSFTETWEVRYRVRAWVPANSNFEAVSDVTFKGDQASINAYAIFNHIYSTSYRPVYYHNVYRLKSAGYTAGYGHALGISLSDSNSRGDTSLKRSFTVELLYTKNCTATLNDTAVLWANWTGTGTTNYNDIVTYNFSSNGLQETGDNDDTCQLRAYYERYLVGTNTLYGYSLCSITNDDTLQGFVLSKTTNTGKTKNSATFKIGAPLYYYNSNTDKATGTYTGDNTLQLQQSGIDLRYSTNCASTLTLNKPVYLVGTPSGNNYTLADTWWTQTLPSAEDGKIYIYLGISYSAYQICWTVNHPIYWYKDGALREYIVGGGDLAYVSKGSGSSKFLREDGTWQTVSSGSSTDVQINGTSITSSNVANIITNSAYNASSNKIATMNDLPGNYYPTTWTWTNGTSSGPTASLSGSGMSAVSVAAIPAADGTSKSGIVTTGNQTFGGVKTFSSAPKLSTNTLTTSSGYTVTIPNSTDTLVNLAGSQALTNKTYNGYTLSGACAKAVDTSISAGSSSTNLPTSAAVASFVDNKILYGTQDPDSSQGITGTIYIQLA